MLDGLSDHHLLHPPPPARKLLGKVVRRPATRTPFTDPRQGGAGPASSAGPGAPTGGDATALLLAALALRGRRRAPRDLPVPGLRPGAAVRPSHHTGISRGRDIRARPAQPGLPAPPAGGRPGRGRCALRPEHAAPGGALFPWPWDGDAVPAGLDRCEHARQSMRSTSSPAHTTHPGCKRQQLKSRALPALRNLVCAILFAQPVLLCVLPFRGALTGPSALRPDTIQQ